MRRSEKDIRDEAEVIPGEACVGYTISFHVHVAYLIIPSHCSLRLDLKVDVAL